jgi:hypothetical protein
MDKIFDLDLPPMDKLVMLGLGSYADDDGGSCFPSVTTLANRTGLSRRGTQKILRRLEGTGLLTSAEARVGSARRYKITLGSSANPVHIANVVRSERGSQGRRTRFRGGANQSAESSEPGSPDSVIDSVIEPSVTPCEDSPTKKKSKPKNQTKPTYELRVPQNLDHEAGRNVWQGTLAKLAERINRHSFDTWLKPTHGEGIKDGVLYVRVPTADHCFVREKYDALLRELLPSGLKVEFVAPMEVCRA